ncbi:MAG TPA: lipid-A-disaccharide synthase [Thermoanaerobaculia bacterium]|jgi:lipid-A-disaccharide synthase
MNLLISAGEASGDLHGSRLLQALRKARPLVQAFGMGGSRMEAAGLQRIVSSDTLAVWGVAEVLEKLPVLRKALSALDAAARSRSPAAAVLIDFPDFHGLLARRLRRRGVPLIYYVSPQVWAWRRYRARRIAQSARRIITLFPFEAEIYRRLGADAVCAGHPLVEDVREGLAVPSPLAAKTRRRLVLLPGSRETELRRHWETLAEAAVALAKRFDLEVVAVRAPSLSESLYTGAAERGIRVVSSGMHPVLASADLALVASGTATLEAALCGAPMVVFYKTSAFSWTVARILVRLRWASLVNIVAQEEVVPELIQDAFTADNVVAAGARLLGSAEKTAAMRAGLARVAEELGPPGASARAAALVLSAVEGPP